MARSHSFNRRVLLFSVPPLFQSAVSFALLPLMTLVLGPRDYGTFALVTAVTSFGTALSTLGAGYVLAQRWPTAAEDERRRLVTSLLLLSVVVALAFALLLPAAWQQAAAYWDVAAEVPELGIRLGAATVAFAAPWILASEVLTLDGRATAFATVMVAQTLCSAAASLTALFVFDFGVLALFLGALAGAVATGIGGILCLTGWLRPGFDRQVAADTVKLGVPLSVSNLLDIATQIAERTLLSAQVGLSALGIYSHSQSYLNIAQAGIKPVVRAAWPISLGEARDADSVFGRTARVWRIGYLMLTGAGLLFATFGRDIVGLLTHGKFVDAAPFAALWMALLLVRLSGRPQLATLFAYGRGYAISKVGIASNALALALLLLLVPRIGLAGAVAAAFAQAAATRLLYWFVVRHDRVTPMQDGWPVGGVALIGATLAAVELAQPDASLRALLLVAVLLPLCFTARHAIGDLGMQLRRGMS
ncbi:MAG: lipopolysaccharide biosynthesis protein [Acetobacterales bacterium]